MCSDSYKLYLGDVQADEHPTSINATTPAISHQQNLDFAVAWTAERSAGSSLHDVYARFFNMFGVGKGNQFRVNLSALDATGSAMASDANDNVFIAWQEYDATTQNGKILVSKYNSSGNLPIGPIQVDLAKGRSVKAGETQAN